MTSSAQQLRSIHFGAKARGYAPADVDPLLASVADQLDRLETITQPSAKQAMRAGMADELRGSTFGPTSRGYHPSEVDAVITSLVSWLSSGSEVPWSPPELAAADVRTPLEYAQPWIFALVAVALVVFLLV